MLSLTSIRPSPLPVIRLGLPRRRNGRDIMDLDTPLPLAGIRRKVDQLDVGPLCLIDEDHYPRKAKKCRRTDEDVEQIRARLQKLTISELKNRSRRRLQTEGIKKRHDFLKRASRNLSSLRANTVTVPFVTSSVVFTFKPVTKDTVILEPASPAKIEIKEAIPHILQKGLEGRNPSIDLKRAREGSKVVRGTRARAKPYTRTCKLAGPPSAFEHKPNGLIASARGAFTIREQQNEHVPTPSSILVMEHPMHTKLPLSEIGDPIAPLWPSTSWVASTPSKCFHPRSEPRDLAGLDDGRLMVATAAASRRFEVLSGGSLPSMELLEEDCDDSGDDNVEQWFDAVEDAQSPPSLDESPVQTNVPIISTTPPWLPMSRSSQSSSPASTSATAGSPSSLVDDISPPTSVSPEASTPEQPSSSPSSIDEDERACQQFFAENSPEGARSSHRQGFFYGLLRKANRNRDYSL